MSDFEAELQTALGGQYRIDRELGGGGMSRVFVAQETALERLVVVKLLPPEMAAAVSAERFRREIQLVARLQHPHIVPVLAAGTANGLLYYTMPFVDGRSLRERLASGGALPVDDAIAIIREVAGALAYAHAQGLVHRDIKPENVLLSQGHALVTDFGIAKALGQDATSSTGTVGGLTGMGMSIGTPAYMAPEQGVGDPSTDHRADIYSLGVMAYELLTGATPFGDRTTTHALLMAHMVEPPAPIAERRPELPAPLAALVMRCLAKKPEDRPQTGDAIVRALRDASSGTGSTASVARAAGGRPGASSSRNRLAIAAVALVAVAAGGVWMTRERGATRTTANGADSNADRVTVTTFVNETGNATLDPVGRMTADWLTTAMVGTGLMKVLDARASLGAAGAKADATTALQTARDLGAGTLVTGSYYQLGDSLQFDVRLIDTRTSEVVEALPPVKGPASDPSAAIDLVRQRTLGVLATRFNPMLAEMSKSMSRPPSYDAYKEIVAGMDAFFAQKLPDARTRFVRASQLDTANVQARTWLLEVLESTGAYASADSLVRELETRRDRLSPLEQAQLDEYASSIRKHPEANVAAAFRMHALAPNGHWRATLARKLMLVNRWQEALDTLDAAPAEVGLFKDKPFPLEQRRQLLHRLGRHEEEREVIRELARRFPNPTWPFEEARVLAALGRTDSLQPLVDSVIAALGPRGGSSRTPMRTLADELRAHGHAAEAQRILAGVLASYDRIPADSQLLPAVARGRAETLARMGRWAEAYALARPAVIGDTTLGNRMSLAVGAARSGDRSLADALDREIAARPEDPYRPGEWLYLRARLAIARGDRAGALSFLRAAQARFFPLYDAVHTDIEFAELRDDPAFEALFRR